MLLFCLLVIFILYGFCLYERWFGERMRRLLRGLLGLPCGAQFGERLRVNTLRLRLPWRFWLGIALRLPDSRLHVRLIGSAGFEVERMQTIVIRRVSLSRLIRHCYWLSGRFLAHELSLVEMFSSLRLTLRGRARQ